MQFVLIGPDRLLAKAFRKLMFPRKWLGMSYNNLEARLFDLRYRTDTAGKTPFQDLDVKGDSVPHGTGYQAVNERHFHAVIRGLNVPPSSGFLDIGCGKGKPLLLASRHPNFSTIVGVELSKNLCDIAAANVAIYGKRFPCKARIEVINADAVRFDIPSGVNVVYLNNPFDACLMRKLLNNISRSLESAPRQLWLFYYNPARSAVIEAGDRFSVVRDYRFFGPGRNVRVYAARAAA
jgi:SAM-dependent methyltransferase